MVTDLDFRMANSMASNKEISNGFLALYFAMVFVLIQGHKLATALLT